MKTSTAFTFALTAGAAFASAPNPGSAWKKTLFLDDFNGGSGAAPDSSKWILQTGTSYPGGASQWGTGEIETYTSSGNNVRQAGNGNLWIIPVKSNSGAWTSARIETVINNFQAPAGGKLRVEASIKQPSVTSANGLGYWPAFWALGGAFRGNYTNWPFVGELDIMENINGADGTNEVIHCDKNPGGICNEPNGLGHADSCSGSRCPGNFHTYAMIIDRTTKPEQVGFYVDGVAKYTVNANQLGSVWTQTVNSGFYLILNVAMGGAYPNAVAGVTTPTSNTVSGRQMAIDYVAVWST